MRSFPVLVLGLAVCFLSLFPDSLPQLFLRCLLPFSLPHFSHPVRFLSSAFRPIPATQLSVSSVPLFPLLPHSGFHDASVPLSLSRFPPYLPPDFSFGPSGFPYLASCLFPFILPRFAPTAVPRVLAFCFRLRPFPFISAFFRPLHFRF